ncbi:MAG: 1-acyl-sn-glycerol-3-phosphate acyltransferase [Hyphomonadaceae bacterium]
MTEKAITVTDSRSVFLPDEPLDGHIVDVLIRERCPSFATHWTWPAVRPVLYSLLGYGKARKMADGMASRTGRQAFDYLARTLDVQLDVNHLDRLPETGRVVVASNHPTGLADGVAVWDALMQRRKDVVFFANADALRVNPDFEDVIIPIEWVEDKRSPAKTRETLKRAAAAFEEEKCIVIFPSGKLAKMQQGILREQEWFPTVVSLARKRKAPIVPLHVSARNSRLYYMLAGMNGELRDITLFHELLNKKRANYDLAFGPEISPETLQGDATEVTNSLQAHVAYAMAEDPGSLFVP